MTGNNSTENVPFRPIISNIGTSSYGLAQHLAKLPLLNQSEFTVKHARAFMKEFKNMLPPDNYKLITFDATSLFTNVPLDYTTDIILK